MTLSSNIRHKKIDKCPQCNPNIVTKNDKIVRPANAVSIVSDEELINSYCISIYPNFKKFINEEDFKQEIRLYFFINRKRNMSRTYMINYFFRDLLGKLKRQYNSKTDFEFVPLNENIIDYTIEDKFNRIELDDIYKLLVYYSKNLTPKQIEVLELRYRYNLSYKEIGKMFGNTKQAISQLENYAIIKLKLYMKDTMT